MGMPENRGRLKEGEEGSGTCGNATKNIANEETSVSYIEKDTEVL